MKTNLPTLALSSIFTVLAVLWSGNMQAQEASADTTTEESQSEESQEDELEQLRLLREELTEAVIAGDVEKQIEYVRPSVVTIWQNNQVARGHDGLREFMADVQSGDSNIFQGYTERPTSDEVEILAGGNTAIAYGRSVPHYNWLGMEFDLENRWTATLVKADGQWKIAMYHVSGNLVDNPILTAAKNSLYWAAGIGLLIGLVLGLAAARLMARKRQAPAQ